MDHYADLAEYRCPSWGSDYSLLDDPEYITSVELSDGEIWGVYMKLDTDDEEGQGDMMTGRGRVNDWFIPYDNTKYLGYIEDMKGNKIHVPEKEALKLCEMLTDLIDAMEAIADRFDTYDTLEAKSLCEFAYDELLRTGNIIPDAQGKPHVLAK